jgi:hypothetical protein
MGQGHDTGEGMKNSTISLAVILCAFLFITTGCGASVRGHRLAHLDKGWHWEVFEEVGVGVKTPDDWHRKVSQAPNSYTGSVSVEDCSNGSFYKTGFSVIALGNIRKDYEMPPSKAAVAYMQNLAANPDATILETDPLKKNGQRHSCIIRFRHRPKIGNDIIVHHYVVAMDEKNMLYIFIFESSTDQWDTVWKTYGIPMMGQIAMP